MNHHGKALLVFCMAVSMISVHAQNVIPATGADATGSGGTVSYTIGQVTFSSLSGTSGTVMHGVQQPYEISVVSAVDDAGDIQLSFTVYPNPVSGMLTLSIKDHEIKSLSYRMFGISGNLVDTKEIFAPEPIIHMQNPASGASFL